jgi:cobalt transporter subunit CbtA
MIGRYVLAALFAGILAGVLLSGIQYFRLSPLIAAAEVFEEANAAKTDEACTETMPGMKMCGEDGAKQWEPAPGLERFGLTSVASLIAGGGFALVLAGLSQLVGIPITRQNGWVWGLLGFLSVHVATGAGLPPEVPGMPVADLLQRQVWWLGTIIATGTAIYLFTQKKAAWAIVFGVVLVAGPHLIGAPQAPHGKTTVPPALAAEFAANAIAAAAVFWVAMGVLLGRLLPHIEMDPVT